jgi:hypothetical protein
MEIDVLSSGDFATIWRRSPVAFFDRDFFGSVN